MGLNPSKKIEFAFFLLLLIGASTVVFFILKPYVSALFVALVLAVVSAPLYRRIFARLPRENLAAFCTMFLLAVFVLVPVSLFSIFMFDDARSLYLAMRTGSADVGIDRWVAPLEQMVRSVAPEAEVSLSGYLREGLSSFVARLGRIFSGAVSVIFQVGIMFFALFYLLRDGEALRRFVVRFSPLPNEYDERILRRIEDAITSVVTGRLIIIVIQGVVASAGFWLFGVPHPVLFGALTLFSALIPAVGVALVFVPLTLYLFTVSVWAALGLLIFGVFVGLLDNALGPLLLGSGLRIHPLLILLSVLGGLAFFGPVGFLAGPVTLSLLFALFDVYPLLLKRESE